MVKGVPMKANEEKKYSMNDIVEMVRTIEVMGGISNITRIMAKGSTPPKPDEPQEVIFKNPNWGYPKDQALAKKYLEVGKSYAVENKIVGDWHTDIILKEFPKIAFNSVLFDEPQGRKCDECGGSGRYQYETKGGAEVADCPRCHGSGQSTKEDKGRQQKYNEDDEYCECEDLTAAKKRIAELEEEVKQIKQTEQGICYETIERYKTALELVKETGCAECIEIAMQALEG